EGGADGTLTLGGRVVALEEVDAAPQRWVGRIVIELVARDTAGKIVWSDQVAESVALPVQSPEGLARAITVAMQRIAARVAPAVGDLCDRQVRADRARHVEAKRSSRE